MHQIRLDARELREGLVNAVDLQLRNQALNDGHHAFADVAVQRVVGAKRHAPGCLKAPANLKPRLAHLDPERLRFRRAADHAAVVVRQHHDRRADQVGAKNSLTTAVEAVAVN